MSTTATEQTTDTAETATGDDATVADDAQVTTTDPPPVDDVATPDEQKALGDAGKQALDRMKTERKAALDRAKAAEAKAAALEAAAQGREAEHKAEQEAQKVRDEALAGANQRILKAEVRAAAANKLADPADALRFIDLSEFEVDSDGVVDADAIAAAITDLIEKKPYLAAQGKRFEGSADAGVRKETKVAQLSKADVEKLAREGKHDEIEAARVAGRLNKLLGIT